MTEPVHSTRPPSEQEKILRQKFYEALTAQGDLLDKVAERLLTLELAVPGLVATALTLVQGQNASLKPGVGMVLAAGCWILALFFTLRAIIPQNYRVDTTLLQQDPAKLDQALGIEDFFRRSARFKQVRIIASCVFFFAGILAVIFSFR